MASVAPEGLLEAVASGSLMSNFLFRTFVAGAGFFADSYDLFITDGVGNILKNLGPVNPVAGSFNVSQACYNSSGLQNAPFFAYGGTAASATWNTSAMPMQINPITGTYNVPSFVVTLTTSAGGGPAQAGYANFQCPAMTLVACAQYVWADAGVCAMVPNPNWNAQIVPYYQVQTTYLKNGLNNASSFGNVFGQLFFGLIGDLLGRKISFIITSCLIIFGCLGAASSAGGTPVQSSMTAYGLWNGNGATPPLGTSSMDVYGQLYFWRTIVGLGTGGEYPLAASITSEANSLETRGRAVLSIFSMQGFGKVTAAVLNYACVANLNYYGGPWTADAIWRFTIAFGCVPNLLTLYWRFMIRESDIYTKQRLREISNFSRQRLRDRTNNVDEVLNTGRVTMLPLTVTLECLWEYRWTLFGTASTWFLIDVTFYGQSLLNTTIVNTAVAGTSTNSVDKLRWALSATVYIMLIALPGYFFAIALVDRMGRYWLTQFGFAMSGLCFSILAGNYFKSNANGAGVFVQCQPGAGGQSVPLDCIPASHYTSNNPYSTMVTDANSAGFVVVYGLTYFFANFGPNSTTFLMPTECVPTRIRTTAHGISAATGKIGAICGALGLLAMWYSFCTLTLDPTGAPNCTASFSKTSPLKYMQQNQSDNGLVAIMALCAGISFLGNIVTFFFVHETGGKSLEEIDSASVTLAKYDLLSPLSPRKDLAASDDTVVHGAHEGGGHDHEEGGHEGGHEADDLAAPFDEDELTHAPDVPLQAPVV